MAHYNVSKRDWLASLINPDTGKPYAIAGSRGRFSAAAEAVAAGHTFTEPVKAAPAPKAPKAVSLVKVAPKVVTPKAPALDSKVYDAESVRTWGRANGFEVGDRGRFSRALLTAYAASGQAVERTVKAPKPVETLAEAQAVKPQAPRAAAASPLSMPKVRPQSVAYALVTHRQDKPGASPILLGVSECSNGHLISRCTCPTMTTDAQWGSAPLSLVKPVV